jgi:hypothetical protein
VFKVSCFLLESASLPTGSKGEFFLRDEEIQKSEQVEVTSAGSVFERNYTVKRMGVVSVRLFSYVVAHEMVQARSKNQAIFHLFVSEMVCRGLVYSLDAEWLRWRVVT